ncbi:MAG: response regulator [Mucilaginibacter polytrichastri]|nr:response regulator [Mucilaginibacter polytrichastri]
MLKISFRKQLIFGFGLCFLLVLGISVNSYRSIVNLEDDKFKVEHTEQVLSLNHDILTYLLNAETAQRGYVITNNPDFLKPYETSVNQISPAIARLRELLIDNPSETPNVDSLDDYATRKQREMAYILKLHREQGFAAAQERILKEYGKYDMDQCRKYLDRINDQETALLSQRRIKSVKSIFSSIQAIIIGGILFTTLICVLFYVIQRFFLRQKVYEKQILKTNTELESVLDENREKNWVLTGLSHVGDATQGQVGEQEMAEKIISAIGRYTEASLGTVYLHDEHSKTLQFVAGYAIPSADKLRKEISIHETWMGQSVAEGEIIAIDGPANPEIRFETSLLSANLLSTYIIPFYFDKKLVGVLELAYQQKKENRLLSFFGLAQKNIGEAIHTAQARTTLRALYEQMQQQAEELETQQEELRTTNEELVYKTQMLQSSEEELRVQQDELTIANTELQDKASLLEQQNAEIEQARADIARKVEELERTGRYKSEFLANMSHELRTPLNSILVLARILRDNQKQNLNSDQVKYADVIFKAGTDLLELINDILDLTKIESGKMELNVEEIRVEEITSNMQNLFGQIAENKSVIFSQTTGEGVERLQTDQMRLEQIIKNLLSNAFKFTPEKGSVALNVVTDGEETVFSVKDSGIGIPEEKQKLIFEAFKQADGSTSRKYGGTGLGLAISRELVSLLGGTLSLKSEPGQGSEFIVRIPTIFTGENGMVERPETASVPAASAPEPLNQIKMALPVPAEDGNTKPVLLIVEDDVQFAEILSGYAREQGYRTLVLHEGTHVVETVKEKKPLAVILDIMLPGQDGWTIIRKLKSDPQTSHIPVHMMSAGDTTKTAVEKAGALSFLKKPVDKESLDNLFRQFAPEIRDENGKILLIEDHEHQSSAVKALFENRGIPVDQAYNGRQGVDMLQKNPYTCVVLDLNLPDISGFDLLDEIKSDAKFSSLPIIINTAMELDREATEKLTRYANATILKSNKSSERLIDEVSLFLHKIQTDPQPKSETARRPEHLGETTGQASLRGRKILLADDDMRNIFALSTALQQYGLDIEIANDGVEALEKLDQMDDIDLVLMDIMMPRMDGYEAMQNIRRHSRYKRIPVIALTAKAMQSDREKCIEAGANDYVTKPVDIDLLISLLQIWIR